MTFGSDDWNNRLKLMSGNDRYSDRLPWALRRGNVHRNAFASSDAICCWLNEMDLVVPRFNSGMADGISSGRASASRIIFGKSSAKKDWRPLSSLSWNNLCSPLNRHVLLYFVLYDNIAATKSFDVRMSCERAVRIRDQRSFTSSVSSSFLTTYSFCRAHGRRT